MTLRPVFAMPGLLISVPGCDAATPHTRRSVDLCDCFDLAQLGLVEWDAAAPQQFVERPSMRRTASIVSSWACCARSQLGSVRCLRSPGQWPLWPPFRLQRCGARHRRRCPGAASCLSRRPETLCQNDDGPPHDRSTAMDSDSRSSNFSPGGATAAEAAASALAEHTNAALVLVGAARAVLNPAAAITAAERSGRCGTRGPNSSVVFADGRTRPRPAVAAAERGCRYPRVRRPARRCVRPADLFAMDQPRHVELCSRWRVGQRHGRRRDATPGERTGSDPSSSVRGLDARRRSDSEPVDPLHAHSRRRRQQPVIAHL